MTKINYIPEDNKKRCKWVLGGNQLYYEYHDQEWGVPVHDDARHFEFLVLEGAQAGLSWSTVLNKRENYRRAFAGFDASKVSRFSESKVAELMQDASIIRNQLKIRATIGNARAFLEIVKEFGGFDAYVWRFVGGSPIQGTLSKPVTSPESDALSKDLKKRGFKFVGSTIIYAHMQAVGMINDHDPECFRRAYCAKLS
jgi:DNA-3-methyladenine glycosylase I